MTHGRMLYGYEPPWSSNPPFTTSEVETEQTSEAVGVGEELRVGEDEDEDEVIVVGNGADDGQKDTVEIRDVVTVSVYVTIVGDAEIVIVDMEALV